ncbi:MAG: right-handed parallel beta-helix repeat-containing protein [Oscillospiraceae bacterium]|nr:right-handed parallel beta-helix repeat-containing protein [Oscillospiraceae bacterium]
MSNTYHVAKSGSDKNNGTESQPFLTINMAASKAASGDTIIVHEGEYREWVKPKESGLSNARRITYEAYEGEKVIIKGSERIQSWEKLEGSVWRVMLPNSFFGVYNPYLETVIGDWLINPIGHSAHLGDVYLDGMSFYEAENLEGVQNPKVNTKVLDNWTNEVVPVKNPDQMQYRWFAQVDDKNTIIYANFHDADPNISIVEINVRKCCFYPEHAGVDYITVRGFEMAQAATPWSPPTADQPGLIGAHWSKGWIIENNIIHDSKCSGISIGKEASTGNNFRTFRKDKPGYQYQLESVFSALKAGWSKEKIGSHIIRNNTIYDCGQNGIVGNLGCVFSEIYNNHIYSIALKREFYGHEIAGIKLHAAIDVQIHNNHIHDCSLGIWLDWQAQGTRVSKNLFYNNNRDFFIEVSHGPAMVDHNIFGSKYSVDNHAQGTAFINNIFAGKMILRKVLNRATPYHAMHSTDVTGYAMVYGADDRLYQNIFIGGRTLDLVGTSIYDGCTESLEEYIEAVDARDRILPSDLEIFQKEEQPAYINGNCYFNGARAFSKEGNKLYQPDFDTCFAVDFKENEVYLNIKLPEDFKDFISEPYGTHSIPKVRIVDADYDNPDGSILILDSDYLGADIRDKSVAGPIACLKNGENRIKVWRK